MPKICYFFGISIYIYYREHQPPHFLAVYGGEDAQIAIENLTLMSGRLSPRVMGLVVEWASLHQEELKRIWLQAMAYETLDTIEPLK